MSRWQEGVVLSRRSALRMFVTAGVLVVTGHPLSGMTSIPRTGVRTIAERFGGGPGPLVLIHPDNSAVIHAPIPDMGTGVETALPMILAEAMDLDWRSVSVERLVPEQVPDGEGGWVQNYSHQGTGGSASVRTAWPQLRKCGALARQLILRAAAAQLGAPMQQLKTTLGQVHWGEKVFPFAQFIDATLMLDAGLVKQTIVSVRSNHELPTYEIDLDGDFMSVDPDAQFGIVGQGLLSPRIDAVLTGQERFGIDHDFPGQRYASIERCPYIGGDIDSFDATMTRKVSGVIDVVEVPRLGPADSDYKFNAPGIAVLASTYWAALQGRRRLQVSWHKGTHTHENNQWHLANSLQAISEGEPRVSFTMGDVEAALSTAAERIESIYHAPHFAHLTMEPMNCAAWVNEQGCVVTGGSQYPNLMINEISELFGFSREAVRYLPGKLGCGFGRRAQTDYIAEAVYLSQSIKRPVKVIWTREDDVQQDFFNPMSAVKFRGGVDSAGNIVAWDCLFASQGRTRMDAFPTQLIANMRVAEVKNDSRLPLGAWRGPGHNLAGFYAEGFLNELATLADRDPYELRISLLGEDRVLPYAGWYPAKGEGGIDTARNKAVLKAVAERAQWGQGPCDHNYGRGIASHFTFGSFVAMVVEVSVDRSQGEFVVERVTAAVDCGLVVNPAGARAQIEGGIIDGLSAVLYQNVQVDGGRVTSTNFDTLKMTRINQAPRVMDIFFINLRSEPFGTGEVALPPFIPALMAALYDATGVRIRSLPIGEQLRA